MKWKYQERKALGSNKSDSDSGINCRHCGYNFSKKSKKIKYYPGSSYLCDDCKGQATKKKTTPAQKKQYATFKVRSKKATVRRKAAAKKTGWGCVI